MIDRQSSCDRYDIGLPSDDTVLEREPVSGRIRWE